jgi:HEAT repeat protein
MNAVGSPDVRVATAAVDFLGRSAAPEAATLLAEQLVHPGTSPMFRQHVLVALGKIADPATGPGVLDFLKTVSDPDLRGAAIHALGEIGNASTRGQLQELSAAETDPKLKALIQDAVARIDERAIHPGPTRKGGMTVFTSDDPGRPSVPVR